MILAVVRDGLEGGGQLQYMIQDMWTGADKEVLLSIPLFILAGNVMTRGSIAERLIGIVRTATAWLPGGMAAAMSTADGLLLAIANALSHDLYFKIIDPKAETKTRLLVARILLLVIGAAGALVASMQLTGILGAVAWAFCFAMSGLFFPLVLGVWWKRANRPGAIAGMLIGLASGWGYLIAVRSGMEPWIGLDHLRFGIVGAAASLVSMVVVSLLTKEPDEEIQRMVDEVRIPKGDTILSASH